MPEDTPADHRAKQLLHYNCSSCHVPGFILSKRFDAAGCVDVFGRLFSALLKLRAEGRIRARERTSNADLDVCLCHACEGEDAAERNARQQDFLHS